MSGILERCREQDVQWREGSLRVKLGQWWIKPHCHHNRANAALPGPDSLACVMLCWEHESLIRWLQSWDSPPAGNQEARVPVRWACYPPPKDPPLPRSPWGRRKVDVVLALAGYCKKCRVEVWALTKAPGDFSRSWHFLKLMSRAVGRMTPKPSLALSLPWIAS